MPKKEIRGRKKGKSTCPRDRLGDRKKTGDIGEVK